MKQMTVALCAVLAVCAGVVVANIGHNNGEVRTISVVGQCLTTAPRDRTAITLRVTTLDKSAAKSMRDATEIINEITAYLKTQDVKMQTTEFNSYEKTEWNHTAQKSVSLGIETTISVDVSASDINIIEDVLNHFAGRENIFTENLRTFTSAETMQPILDGCLATAVQNARVRADAVASGDGRRAGKMLAASYSSNGGVQNYASNFLRSAKAMAVAEDAAPMITGGIVSRETEVSVTVSAVFEIK